MRSLILASAADADSGVMEQRQFLPGRPWRFNMPAEHEMGEQQLGGKGWLGQEVSRNKVQ